ncbi:MAG: hypothetical protein ACK5NA_07315 [Enterococcus sp.]
MDFIRQVFMFFINHYDFFAILFISIAVISLSIKSGKQQEEIDRLKHEIQVTVERNMVSEQLNGEQNK